MKTDTYTNTYIKTKSHTTKKPKYSADTQVVPNTNTKKGAQQAQKGGKSPGKEAVFDDFKKKCRFFNF